MKRRKFLKGMLAAGASAGFRLPLANAADYRGKLFVFVQADGGWDPTSFCDPKANAPGEPLINHWALAASIRQAGNIPYAPFARNRQFFEKYYQRMLVINGVDSQTNSHTAGIIHNWSGRISEGYPTTTALLAARNGPGQAMPYLSFGGFSNTAGVTAFTRLKDPEHFQAIARPEWNPWDSERPFLGEQDWAAVQSYRTARAARLSTAPNLLPRAARNRRLYEAALLPEATEGLRAFAEMLPSRDELQPVEESAFNRRSELRRQAQITVLAFKAGVAVSADLWLGGFDTHADHDVEHTWLLGNLTDSVDYLWGYAELHGVADRLVVVMGSDFGRTNRYNADAGKDHWPIGSFIVMEKNRPWTNRVVGETDGLHFARKINPATLQRDDAGGTLIHPRHIHKALRRYLGIEDTPDSLRFPFSNTEDLRLFG
ncbi:MAG: DUF1501 domain-containing protein [Rhodospirillaceae bacterium]|nr:DUF1501 domain-containing protein [Rhodospirillaceae bacterium]